MVGQSRTTPGPIRAALACQEVRVAPPAAPRRKLPLSGDHREAVALLGPRPLYPTPFIAARYPVYS